MQNKTETKQKSKIFTTALAVLAEKNVENAEELAEIITRRYFNAHITDIDVQIEEYLQDYNTFMNPTVEISLDIVKHQTRKREIVQARQWCMWCLCEFTTMSLKSIGAAFRGKDHSTVIHARQTCDDLADVGTKERLFREYLKIKYNHMKNSKTQRQVKMLTSVALDRVVS